MRKTNKKPVKTTKKKAAQKKPAKATKKTTVKKKSAKATKKTSAVKKTTKKKPVKAVKKPKKNPPEKKKAVAKKPEKKAKTAAKAKTKEKAKKAPAKTVAVKTVVEKPVPKPPKKPRLRKMSPEKVARFRDMLLALRDRLTGQITVLKKESLRRTDDIVSEEDGTDAFERQFALALAGTDTDAVFEIDEALRRISLGTYSICEDCGCRIEKARLEALPSVRLCIGCKSEREKGKVRYNPMAALRSRK